MFPLRLGVRFSPPELALEYSSDSQTRLKIFPLGDVQRRSADEISSELSKNFPDYLGPKFVRFTQLKRLIDRAKSAKKNFLPSEDEDFNKLDDSALKSVKDQMSVNFSANQLKPGDKGFEYDRRIEFEDGTEPSEWD